MNKNKQILKHCPNFYKIINFEFQEKDKITPKIIEIYKAYIFNTNLDNLEEVKKLEKIDIIITKYLEDYTFKKELQKTLLELKFDNTHNFCNTAIDKIISLFDNYEIGYTRNIYFARWI